MPVRLFTLENAAVRTFLLWFGWIAVIGSIFDGALVIYAALLAALQVDSWMMSVDTLFREHIQWLYWVKQLAYVVLPADLVVYFFALPAMLLFTVRVVVSSFIGKWALNRAADYAPTANA